MKLFTRSIKTALKFITATATTLALSIPSYANGVFRPSAFKVKFYEIGLRNSATAERTPIFLSTDGTTLDLSNTKDHIDSLSAGQRTPALGSWDQVYALLSNTITASGNDGTCFIENGATDTDNDGRWEIVTAVAANAGEGSYTEPSYGDGGFLGPNDPSVTSNVNGTPVTSLKQWLVSSSNPTPGGGGAINRMLFIGTPAQPVVVTDGPKKVTYYVDVNEALRMVDGTGNNQGCAAVRSNIIRFNIGIE